MLPLPALACFYGAHNFDPKKREQTTAYALINERYSSEQTRAKDFYRAELKRTESDVAAHGSDPDYLDDYGFILHKNGKDAEAIRLWSDLIQNEPNRFTTLCNMATLFHNQGRYDDATTCLAAAIKSRPQFRNNAEQYHLQMVDFQKRQLSTSAYAAEHVFLDELTPVWKQRRTAPETLEDVKPFPEVKVDGVAELLRQYPKFGDGWLALGILLEHDGEHSLANRAYDRAIRFGSSHRQEIKEYLRTYTPFAAERDPGRAVGRRLKWVIILGVSGTVILLGLMLSRSMILDISAARREREAQQRRAEKHEGPL
ncbi:MAG: hypothetical protein ACR2IE_12180 [Candidatus Sumerlaeaceae bacterium]